MPEEFGQPIEPEPEEEEESPEQGLADQAKEMVKKEAGEVAKKGAKAAGEAAKKLAQQLAAKAAAFLIANWPVVLAVLGLLIAAVLIAVFLMACVPALKCEHGKCPTEGTNVVNDISTLRLAKALSGSEEDRKKAILEEADKIISDLEKLKPRLDSTTQKIVDDLITQLRTIISLKAEGKPTREAVNTAFDLLEKIKDVLIEKLRSKLVDDNWTVVRVGEINFRGSTTDGACSSRCDGRTCQPCTGKDGTCEYIVYRAKNQDLQEKIAQAASLLVGLEHKTLDPGNQAQCKSIVYAALNVIAGLEQAGYGALSGNPYISTGALPANAYFEEIMGSPAVQRGDLIWFTVGNSPNCTGNSHWAIEL